MVKLLEKSHKFLRPFLLFLYSIFPVGLSAEVYKFVGRDGSIVYTDNPEGSGSKIVIPSKKESTDPDWDFLGSAKMATGQSFNFFLNKKRINSIGNGMFNAWVLYDHEIGMQNAGGAVYKSEMVMEEYDCSKRKSDVKVVNCYSDHMGVGSVVSSYQSRHPSPYNVPPGSISDHVLDLICGK